MASSVLSYGLWPPKRRLAMTHLPEEVTPTDDEDLKRRLFDNLDPLDRAGKLKVLDFSRELVAERGSPLTTRHPKGAPRSKRLDP
jgi:hypothetical protein